MGSLIRSTLMLMLGFAGGLHSIAVHAAASCEVGSTTNVVVLSVTPDPGGQLLLQQPGTSNRIFLRRCSRTQAKNVCFFATDVVPGRYYFQEVTHSAGWDLSYPVSTPSLWFEISPIGMTYLGDWTVVFGDLRNVKKIGIKYDLKHWDAMRALCHLPAQRLFLGRTKMPLAEIID
jgi:hypothetical protein